MSALVVYESMWGNTRAVAEAVADGLRRAGEVGVVEVGAAPPLESVDVDLLVVGAPTHAFGLSRPTTRTDAATRAGGTVISAGRGVREWIAGARAAGQRVATFDTHVSRPNLPGSAGRSAAKMLRSRGCSVMVEPESFYVGGYDGPLLPGELERARAWGDGLANLAAVPALV
ncbi:flavodoxin family protein [Georgenia wangjunii]|uniref:flavodoxin family protein n=1 Tax=Georgenia wangjunii TaxID=3117730 RepID=UPI002F2692F0